MKVATKPFLIVVFAAGLVLLSSSGKRRKIVSSQVAEPVEVMRASPVPIRYTSKTKVKVTPHRVRGDLRAFMYRMASIESDNNPRVVNASGMMGKYQFSPRTLRKMGFNVSREEYLSNEALQDSAMVMYMRENHRILRKIIKRYDGQMYRGVFITKSGILASAHLVGHGGVWAFFSPEKYNYPTQDSNGTSVELYMKKFANYKLEL